MTDPSTHQSQVSHRHLYFCPRGHKSGSPRPLLGFSDLLKWLRKHGGAASLPEEGVHSGALEAPVQGVCPWQRGVHRPSPRTPAQQPLSGPAVDQTACPVHVREITGGAESPEAPATPGLSGARCLFCSS